MTAKPQRKALFIPAIILLLAVPVAQQEEKFTARLSPVPVDASIVAAITGSGSVTATLAATKLTITGTFQGLRTPATIAQLHSGAKGVRGPVIFDLMVSKAVAGTISGTLALSRTQVQDLKNGKLYVQIHSDKAPDGNLWGWLLPQER